MKSQRIHISIAFGDAILPVIECEDGHQRVPLKPISDQIGLDWRTQKRKLLGDDYLIDRLGLIMGEASLPRMAELGLKRDRYLVRLDRVTAFLSILSPRMIRSQGNNEAATWLEAKHQEWDDALHAYETNGFAIKPGSRARDVVRVISQIDRIKSPALRQIAARQANDELGLDIPIGKQEGLEL